MMECPASMCPLIAPNGSPWTREYAAPCPGHDGLDIGGCSWWGVACSTGGIHALVERAEQQEGKALVIGPNQPRRGISRSRQYDCPKASVCRWQEQAEIAGRKLCPPRDALARGIGPCVCLF